MRPQFLAGWFIGVSQTLNVFCPLGVDVKMVPGPPPSFLRALTKKGGCPKLSLPASLPPVPPVASHFRTPCPGLHLDTKSIYSQAWMVGPGLGGMQGFPGGTIGSPPLSQHLHPAGPPGPLLRATPTPNPPVWATPEPYVQNQNFCLDPVPHFLKHFLDPPPLLLEDKIYI